MKFSRRDFLRCLPAASAALSHTAHAALQTASQQQLLEVSPNGIHLEQVTLTYENLPDDLEGYRFSFISDIHLGGWLKDEIVEDALLLAKRHGSRALFLGGDLIWVPDNHAGLSDSLNNKKYAHGTDEELGELVFHELARMIRPHQFQDGVFAVLGNHDRWSNYDAFRILGRESQTQFLLNETATISVGNATIELFGSEDLWSGIPQKPSFTEHKNIFRILLTHNPDFASFVFHRTRNNFELALCGHTHGGQVKLPLLGALAYNITDTRYGEGLVDYGTTKFYTSRGVGWVELPIRWNCPPEVTIFTLSKHR
jgi:predicted MPP superfamily phosphohydrolase